MLKRNGYKTVILLIFCLMSLLALLTSASADGEAWLDLPNGLQEIEAEAFAGDTSIQNVYIPESVTRIGASAFAGCTSLQDVALPDQLTDIDPTAFDGCSNARFVVRGGTPVCGLMLERNAVRLEIDWVDDQGNWLYAMYFGNNDAGYHCLTHCYVNPEASQSVTDVYVPGNVEYIAARAFDGCSTLVGIALPDGLYGIGEQAFIGCTALENLFIPDSVQEIDNGAFDSDCSVTPCVHGYTATLETIITANNVVKLEIEWCDDNGDLLYAMFFDNNDAGYHCLTHCYVNSEASQSVTDVYFQAMWSTSRLERSMAAARWSASLCPTASMASVSRRLSGAPHWKICSSRTACREWTMTPWPGAPLFQRLRRDPTRKPGRLNTISNIPIKR